MLSDLGIRFRKTHDVRELLDLLEDADCRVPGDLSDLDTLTPYGTVFRYEVIPSEASLDRAGCRSMVRSLRVWVEKELKKRG